MSIKIKIECVRCEKELDISPPLLFNAKGSILTISVFRCTCKDAEQPNPADSLNVRLI